MDYSGKYMIHATSCHADLVASLGLCLAVIEAYHEDPTRGIPAPNWHCFNSARSVKANAEFGMLVKEDGE